jgi:hypothetical protein
VAVRLITQRERKVLAVLEILRLQAQVRATLAVTVKQQISRLAVAAVLALLGQMPPHWLLVLVAQELRHQYQDLQLPMLVAVGAVDTL